MKDVSWNQKSKVVKFQKIINDSINEFEQFKTEFTTFDQIANYRKIAIKTNSKMVAIVQEIQTILFLENQELLSQTVGAVFDALFLQQKISLYNIGFAKKQNFDSIEFEKSSDQHIEANKNDDSESSNNFANKNEPWQKSKTTDILKNKKTIEKKTIKSAIKKSSKFNITEKIVQSSSKTQTNKIDPLNFTKKESQNSKNGTKKELQNSKENFENQKNQKKMDIRNFKNDLLISNKCQCECHQYLMLMAHKLSLKLDHKYYFEQSLINEKEQEADSPRNYQGLFQDDHYMKDFEEGNFARFMLIKDPVVLGKISEKILNKIFEDKQNVIKKITKFFYDFPELNEN